MMEFLILAWLFCVAVIGYFFIRNKNVFAVRIEFIEMDSSCSMYDKLPGYESMLYGWRYQCLWTTDQWIDWCNHRFSEITD